MICDETSLELSPCDPFGSQPERILIVDDDRDQTQVLSHALNRQGFLTHVAHDLEGGDQAVHTLAPNLVILDIRLPDGDGLSFCRKLSDDPSTCDTPVIIVSGMERSDIVRQARSAGCRFYVRKPYDPNALLLLIEEAIRSTPS